MTFKNYRPTILPEAFLHRTCERESKTKLAGLASFESDVRFPVIHIIL